MAVLTAAESLCDLLPAAQAEQASMDAQEGINFDPLDGQIRPGQRQP
jgi:hypothetical protein